MPAHHIAVGTPAKSVKVKPGWESVAADPGPLPDNREDRRTQLWLVGVSRIKKNRERGPARVGRWC